MAHFYHPSNFLPPPNAPPTTISNNPQPPSTPNYTQPPTTPNYIQPPTTSINYQPPSPANPPTTSINYQPPSTPDYYQPPTTPNYSQPPTTSNIYQPPTTSSYLQPPTTPNYYNQPQPPPSYSQYPTELPNQFPIGHYKPPPVVNVTELQAHLRLLGAIHKLKEIVQSQQVGIALKNRDAAWVAFVNKAVYRFFVWTAAMWSRTA
ncbi:hypothetical protein FRC17_004469, partial [Serendipita sp. 399]